MRGVKEFGNFGSEPSLEDIVTSSSTAMSAVGTCCGSLGSGRRTTTRLGQDI